MSSSEGVKLYIEVIQDLFKVFDLKIFLDCCRYFKGCVGVIQMSFEGCFMLY